MTQYDYDTIDEGYYDEVYHRQKGAQSKWHHLKFQMIAEKLRKQGIHSVLDVGCGPGTFANALDDKLQYCGLDIAYKQVQYAYAQYGSSSKNFLCTSAENIPLRDNSFDSAISIEIIEHLPEEVAHNMLREIYRCLKPGGKLILTTPNYHSTWPILEWVVNTITPLSYEDQHILKFGPKKLKNFLHRCFEDVEVTAFLFSAPFHAALNWKWSDKMFDMENKYLNGFGHLLLATATKESDD